jgi:hypothetical protein
VQPITHAVFAVAFKVPVPAVVGGAGMTHAVWQFDARELHSIMQFVTVEVRGVESPWKGGVTFGVVACASTVLFAPKQNQAAVSRMAKPRMTSSARFSIVSRNAFKENACGRPGVAATAPAAWRC